MLFMTTQQLLGRLEQHERVDRPLTQTLWAGQGGWIFSWVRTRATLFNLKAQRRGKEPVDPGWDGLAGEKPNVSISRTRKPTARRAGPSLFLSSRLPSS